MRLLILAIFTALLISTAPVSDEAVSRSVERARSLATTAFVNDSVIVEIKEEGPAEAPPETTAQTGESSGSPTNPDEEGNTQPALQATIPDGTSSAVPSTNTTNDTPVVSEVEVTTQTNTPSNNESDPGTDTGSTGSSESGTQTTTATAEEILAALLGNQAVVARASGGGGLFGDGARGTEIRVFSDRVRESLRARGITSLSIPNAGSILGAAHGAGNKLTQSDFTLFLSSALLRDENIKDVRLRDGELTTEYRALGRLFGFVPIRYTLRVSLSWEAGVTRDVSARFPWYKFFLRTGVSRSALEALLESEVNRAIKGYEAEFDVATRAFTAVAEVLGSRTGV